MKKIMKLFVLVAAAAMTLASCQKNEISGPVTKEVHFTINAGIAETKTTITDNGDGTYTPSWRNEDKIGIFFTEPTEKVSKVEAEFSNTKEDGETASFEGTASVEGEGTFYAFYPSSAFNQHYGDGTIRLDLPASQKPTSTSFDPACDILVAQPCDYIADGETVVIDNLYFARLMSVLRVNLVGDYAKDQIVESFSVEVDVNANVDITGNAKVDYKNATISAWNNGNINRNVVTATYTNEEYITIAGTNNAAYLVVAPVTIPSGTTLTFTIETENYDIVKTVTAPADMVMPAGNIAVINLTIAEENCTAKTEDTSDYSGEWLIVNSDLTRAANAWANGNNLPEFVLTTNEGVILESDGIANCKMIITKEADGYTIQDASGKYLYAAGGTESNHLKGKTDKSYWTIEKGETNYVITSLAQDTRNILRYNSSSKIFSCYTSGQADVTLYKYSEIKPDTNPSVSVTETTSPSIKAEGGDLTFTCTTKNLDGETLEVVEESEYLTWSVAENVVTITVAPNETAESRTLNAAIKCGSVEVPVTINQAGKPAEGTPVEITDVLTRATTGVTKNSTSYSAWSGKTSNSEAVYAGQSAGGNDAIQLRSNNNNSGVVTTTSGGKVKKIKVTWQSATTSGRTLDIYGKNTAYTAATDLYNTSTQGTKLGSIKYGTSTELEISGDYEYIGFRSNSGALYLTDVEITWEASGSGGEEGGETPADPVQLTMSEITCSAQTENSLTFNWTAVANATGYEVTCNNKTETVNDVTYTVTGLTASTQYTISVKAVGDGTNYTTSEAKTQTGTTAAAQGGGEEGGESTGGTHYVKVTSTPTDWTGEYLIVYETGNVAFDGGLTKLDAVSNTVTISISNGQIAATSEMKAAAFTINNSGHIQAKSGKYVGNDSNTNALPDLTNAAANTLSIDDSGNFVVKSSGGSYLRYNATSGQTRFRYYKSSSYTNQKAIQLYKLN